LRPETDDGKYTPDINSLLALPQAKLLMADLYNHEIKLTDLKSPNNVTASLKLDNAPWCLAALSSTDVALTNDSKCIYRLNVGKVIQLVSKVKTQRKYWGISASSVDDSLIVSCNDSDGPASVDVISRDGKLLRTIVDGNTMPGLSWPRYLCTTESRVFISECVRDKLFTVDFTNGRLLDTLENDHLKSPEQLCLDKEGNIFIGSYIAGRVLVRSPTGEVKVLLEAHMHSEPEYRFPRGVCVTPEGVLVVSWDTIIGDSVVVGYQLK
jgi:hypothetical protein